MSVIQAGLEHFAPCQYALVDALMVVAVSLVSATVMLGGKARCAMKVRTMVSRSKEAVLMFSQQYARPHATLRAQHAILQQSATVIKDGAVLIAMKVGDLTNDCY